VSSLANLNSSIGLPEAALFSRVSKLMFHLAGSAGILPALFIPR
jgi:hypothetical protein